MSTARRRELGSFYTPGWVARWMVNRALSNFTERLTNLKVLDPSCGDGAFVVAVLDWFAGHTAVLPTESAKRLAIVRDHVFGVDADPNAVSMLRDRVAGWVGDDPAASGELAEVLRSNFQHGDALLGPVWNDPPVELTLDSLRSGGRKPPGNIDHGTDDVAPPINWETAFPQVAASGGFDLVIGNPPYRRERNAKQDFDRIAEAPIGRRWRTARMDLWYYFAHRSLDLLKSDGRLSFIVNSYWAGAASARMLRDRLQAETSMLELVLLGSARLFHTVAGQHMIFRLQKGADRGVACELRDLSGQSAKQIEAAFRDQQSHWPVIPIDQAALWAHGRLQFNSANVVKTSTGPVLGDLFEVRQGMAENPPFVTKSAAKELGVPALAGQGVFVLTGDEVAALKLSDQERSLLRPYYALPSIDRFHVDVQPSHHVLYLTKQTLLDLQSAPQVAAHLGRYRHLLERRREVQSGQISWWHLHWPRQERLFIQSRILCHQMGSRPRFAFAHQPTFVGFSIHVIVERLTEVDACSGESGSSKSGLSLAALTAILNSAWACRWFELRAKHRGAHLDISGTVLKQFPLPARVSTAIDRELAGLTLDWPSTVNAESQLNVLVDELYAGIH